MVGATFLWLVALSCVSMARLVYLKGALYKVDPSHNNFKLLSSSLHTLRGSETAAQIWLSLIRNYIPRGWNSLRSAFKIGKYLALFMSFKLGSALLTVMTPTCGPRNLLTILSQVNHTTQTCEAKRPEKPKCEVVVVEAHPRTEASARRRKAWSEPDRSCILAFLHRNQPGER